MSDADEKAVAEALYAVESVHHFHGTECLCGFNSHRARERTAHITRLALGELLGHDFVRKAAFDV
ncbi:hypothetical protein [Gordonia westfalica]|uniref:Uncharacterized protein n=1 Tax=Gordonia westfalica TaxID=158898 RepID=A0A1H2DR19_9ACTN|nr:hypothetical protein [Gordonia westfalica]SDT83692.1 hypothetical protein SAMN04488548_10112 [Gordonia westfalica]SDT83695.1 hypothetical protein SAMN04488548_10115 [Gordonia westfalica]SDT84475.1 hypothetical protein SAMN04488548_10915 [Gordonia westfalica]SDT84513.1 hypothetical protein SAMN04488548_10935 [Gordonia westfalica]SDT84560.1 hypothetical protein SAMN04488548_10952 [Gordonia westfalica]